LNKKWLTKGRIVYKMAKKENAMKNNLFLIVAIFLGNTFLYSQANGNTSIAMLNYLATESRIINSSKNNRLLLEDVYNTLINNTDPSIIDETTQDYLEVMLDDIESFRIITLQRERLQFLFENSQAQALTQAMPNPLYLLGTIQTANPLKIIASVALMTLDSVMNYQNAKNAGEIENLKNNWELDDNESGTLHDLRKRTFSYMIDVARNNNLSGSDTLNEESIDNFVAYKLNNNLQQRKQFLEGNQELYSKYGAYWLTLAETYYNLELYQECINAVKGYENIKAPIFRKDYDYARILPFAIISLNYINTNKNSYSVEAVKYLEKIIANTNESQWALRYFVAQTYISLANIANKEQNLSIAFNLLLNNVRYLATEQERLLKTYSEPINESIARGLTKSQEKDAKELINNLKKARNTELPPLHSGLATNFQTLFLLFNELHISTQRISEINGILNNAFIFPELRHNYLGQGYGLNNIRIKRTNVVSSALSLTSIVSNREFWKEIILEVPAIYLSKDSIINLSIKGESRAYPMQNVSYSILKVAREKNSSITDYVAELKIHLSDEIVIEKDVDYTLTIEISVFDVKCTLIFYSPKGKTNFTYDHIE
jgi:hypothetical protein